MSTKKRAISLAVTYLAVAVGLFMVAQTIYAASTSTLQSSVTVGPATPTISSLTISPSPITLTANTTTPVYVTAILADNNGCSSLTSGTESISLYRTNVSGGAACSPNNENCYQAAAYTATGTCSGGVSFNVTTTFNVYYFADATDASSSYASTNWTATINVTSTDNTTNTAAATAELDTLNAINVVESSISYGSLSASSTSASAVTTTVQNVGNSSSSLDLYGTQFVSGANTIATGSQHFATSSPFNYNTSTALTDTAAPVGGFLLVAPVSTTSVESGVYWMMNVPAGTASGTYNATTTFLSVFHS